MSRRIQGALLVVLAVPFAAGCAMSTEPTEGAQNDEAQASESAALQASSTVLEGMEASGPFGFERPTRLALKAGTIRIPSRRFDVREGAVAPETTEVDPAKVTAPVESDPPLPDPAP